MNKQLIVVALVVLVAAAVLVMLLRGSPEADAGTVANAAASETATPPPARRVDAPLAIARPDAPRKPGITIDDVRFEKTSTCRGEENLVTVIAHASDPDDDKWLRVEINRVAGDRVPLRTYMSDDPNGEPYMISRRVTVRGRDGAFATAELPQPPATDCLRPQELLVSAEPEPYTGGRIRFRAQLLHQREDAAPTVTRFRWIFGDGSQEKTEQPTVLHDFSARPQDRLVSNFLVIGEATLSNDTVVRGRVAVTLENPLFLAAHGGAVTLIAEQGEPSDRGQEIRLKHGAPQPLKITRVVRRSLLESATSDEDELALGTLGSVEIPTDGLTTRLTLPGNTEILAEEYQVDALTADREPVSTTFYVRRPGAEARLLARLRSNPGPQL